MDMKLKGRKKKMFKWILLIILLLFIIFTIYENLSITITKVNLVEDNIPKDFNGFKILQISDYHNKKFLKENYFIEKVKETSPDIIVITGDIINSRKPDYEEVRKSIKEIVKIAPTYYTTGNHEQRLEEFPEFIEKMKEMGIIFLDDESVEIGRGSSKINIIGLNDPTYYGKEHLLSSMEKNIREEEYNVLLCHRPELFKEYVENDVDLVFTGHAHGGQIRVPIIGALFAPNQGFLPEYAEGIHRENNTTMVVSKGIGSSLIPFRIFNKPELVLVELK